MSHHLRCSLDRLREDLLALGQIGRNPDDKGLYRMAFTEADMEARRWLLDRLRAAGADAKLDGAANVVGRWEGADGDLPTIVIGSHIDSVPAGGIFDGSLGVLAGLECMRALRDAEVKLSRPVELVAFSDEEGRFGGMFGVQAYTGQLTLNDVESMKDPDGVSLVDAMKACDLVPSLAMEAARKPDRIAAFLELHIEQGPVLEAQRTDIGVVLGISGIFKWKVKLLGKADHAGTSPMDMRSDAFMGLADFAHEIPRIIEEDGSERSRLTVGKVDLVPGHPHTVPGEAVFTLVGRDTEPDVLRELAKSCRKVLSAIARRHRLYFEFEEMSWLEPRPCDASIATAFRSAAERLSLSHIDMPSGAGHDTQFMTDVTRAGMIFVPSANGVSHAPDEWTAWEDVHNGANCLLQALLDVDAGSEGETLETGG